MGKEQLLLPGMQEWLDWHFRNTLMSISASGEGIVSLGCGKTTKRIGVVGGTFDNAGGKPSGIIGKFFNQDALSGQGVQIEMVNGGYFSDLKNIIDSLQNYDIIFWFVNVPNDLPKIRNIKDIYPHKIVVTSKRNVKGTYSFMSLIVRAIALKSNLLLEFSEDHGTYVGRVIDPLGAVWCDYCADFGVVAHKLVNRASQLSRFTRCATFNAGEGIDAPDESEFFAIVKAYAETFHSLIHPEDGVTRFLGNASFRCERGFPSFRNGELIFVSRRNVDKRYIGKESFVASRLNGDRVEYFGDDKPSVDTPVQLRLYDYFTDVNYMVHSHTYIKGAPFTSHPIPCGALEEFGEIVSLVDNSRSVNFSVNLLGHGSLVFAGCIDYLREIAYVARSIPEIVG